METYEQVDLFSPVRSPRDEKREKLEQALDAIRKKYGGKAISYGDGPTQAVEDTQEEE